MPLAEGTYEALKAYIDGLNLSPGLVVYKDAAGEKAVRPYCTFMGDISATPDSTEGGGEAAGGTTYITELAQLDLWMNWWDQAANKSAESRTLPSALHRALAGCLLPLAPTRVYGVQVRNRIRLLERTANIVHVTYTLAIRRQL